MRFVQAGVFVVGLGIYLVVLISAISPSGFTGTWLEDYVPPIAIAVVAWNILLLIVTILVIVNSVRKVRTGKTQTLATDVFVVKLVAIPFFVVNFVAMGALGLGGWLTFLFGGFIGVAVAVCSIGLTYVAMLSTSIYGWASIARLRRERIIDTGLAVLYSIMLCLSVTDTAAGVMLFGHSRRKPMVALLGIVLAVEVILTAFFLPPISYAFVDFDQARPEWINYAALTGAALIVATIAFSVVRVLRRRRTQAVEVS